MSHDPGMVPIAARRMDPDYVRPFAIDLLHRRLGEAAQTTEGRAQISTISAAILRAVTDGLDGRQADDWKRLSVGALGYAITTIAATGLSPVGAVKELYLFPQGGALQVRVSPAGLMKLAHRSGQIVRPAVVRDGDRFQYALGPTGPVLAHEPVPFGTGAIVGAYCAVYRAGDGALMHVVTMTTADIAVCRAKSPTRGGGPWTDFFEQMALKSVLHRAMSSGKILLEEGLMHALAAAPLAGVEGDTSELGDDQIVHTVPAPPAPGRLARQSVAAPLPELEPEPTAEATTHGGDA